jgi:hypothetical protein
MTVANEIKAAMARAAFADDWAREQEESEDGMNLSGVEIFDVMPDETPAAYLECAERLSTAFCQCNGVASLDALYARAASFRVERYADRKLCPELFGHYCAMEAMGHGVGLDSFGLRTVDGGIVRSGEALPACTYDGVIAVPYFSFDI